MEDDLVLIDYHSWIGDTNNALLNFDCGVKEINDEAIQLHSLEESVEFYEKLGFSEVREYYPGRVNGSKMYYNIESLRDIDFLKVYVNPFLISDTANK